MPSINEVQNVTQLSKIIACSPEYYKEHYNDEQYGDFTLFIVNDGATNGESTTADLYYGKNQISQAVITAELPAVGVENRIYLKTVASPGDRPIGIYLFLNNEYICLTNSVENGSISTEAQNAIVNAVYNMISENAVKTQWEYY